MQADATAGSGRKVITSARGTAASALSARARLARLGFSTNRQRLPLRLQWSLTRQYASWLMQPVWQITRSALASVASSLAALSSSPPS